MSLKNTEYRFGIVAQALHWLIAALIVVQYVLIRYAHAAEAARKTHPIAALEQLAWLARHKSFGITVFALTIVRLAWRLVSPPPAWPRAMPRWQVIFARATHYAFYALLFALPLSGWLMSSAGNHPVSWFNLVQLPDLVAPSKPLEQFLHEFHEYAFDSLFAIAILHVAAALKHRFVDRDGVLQRMLPWAG
jgi:cytochrome b561